MDIISAWYLTLILALLMIKLILFWRQGEKADWQRQILKETEG